MPQKVKVGYRITVVEIRNLPQSLIGQTIAIQFIHKGEHRTRPSQIDGNCVAKFNNAAEPIFFKFFRSLTFDTYSNTFCSELSQFRVILNDSEQSIAQGMFDLAKLRMDKKTEDALVSLDLFEGGSKLNLVIQVKSGVDQEDPRTKTKSTAQRSNSNYNDSSAMQMNRRNDRSLQSQPHQNTRTNSMVPSVAKSVKSSSSRGSRLSSASGIKRKDDLK